MILSDKKAYMFGYNTLTYMQAEWVDDVIVSNNDQQRIAPLWGRHLRSVKESVIGLSFY